MEKQYVDLFLAVQGSKFPEERIYELREMLYRTDENKFRIIQALQYKDPTTLLIISIFLGTYGVDRFMLGETGLGVLKLFTCGGLGIWYLIDLFLVNRMTKEKNFSMLVSAIN